MSFLTDILEQIELKLNIGDVLSIYVALFALIYTVISTKDNQRKSVLPYMALENIVSSVKIKNMESNPIIEDNISDYKAVVSKDKIMKGIEEWGAHERKIILNEEKHGNFTSYGEPNFPQSLKIINTGKNSVVSFTLVVGKQSTYPENISVGEEKVISILLEDKKATFNIMIKFKDIYGNEYKEKIEFYRGNMYLHLELKRVRFSKPRAFFAKCKTKYKIRLEDKK